MDASTESDSSIHQEIKDADGKVVACATTGTDPRTLELGEKYGAKHDLPGFGNKPCDWLD